MLMIHIHCSAELIYIISYIFNTYVYIIQHILHIHSTHIIRYTPLPLTYLLTMVTSHYIDQIQQATDRQTRSMRSFSNLDRSRSIRVKRSVFLTKSRSAPMHPRKSDLATPICAAGVVCLLLKRGRGLQCSAQMRTR